MTKLEEIVQVQQKADKKRQDVRNYILNCEKFLEGFMRYTGWPSMEFRPLESTDDVRWEKRVVLNQIPGMNTFGYQVKLHLPLGGEVKTKFLVSVRNEDDKLCFQIVFLGRSFNIGGNGVFDTDFEGCVAEIKSQIDNNFLTEKPSLTIG